MARVVTLRAPASLPIREMDPREVERFVANMADGILERLDDDVLPDAISAVSLQQVLPGTEQDYGVWVEWTRACCDRRDRIPDFQTPVVDDFERAGSPVLDKFGGEHMEHQMRIVALEYPEMHRQERDQRS